MRFLSLNNRNLKEIFRDPVTLLLGVAMPIALLALFSSLYQKSQMEIFSPTMLTPAITIFSFSFLVMFSGILLGKDRNGAFMTRLLTTPLRTVDFVLAYLLPFIPVALFQIVVCYATGIFLGASVEQWLPIIIIHLLVALTCISLGIILGSTLTLNQISGVGSLLITAISLFSGAWMDLKMVGGFFELFGNLMPFSHAISAVRAITSGAALGELINDLFWVLAYAIICFVLSVYALKWKTRRA